jgi:hypothetical protein
MNWQLRHSFAIWLLYCIPEHREEKRVAPETYQKPIVEEEGLPPVIHQTTASYAPRKLQQLPVKIHQISVRERK